MNDGRYDSDWPGGVFFPQRRCVSLLCVQLLLTSVHFPVLSETVSFKPATLSLRCPSVPFIHTTLVLHYYRSQLKVIAPAVPRALNRTLIEQLPPQTGSVAWQTSV